MRTLRTRILIFLTSVIAVSCAGVGQRTIPVTDPTRRLEFQGFSILPPSGKNWQIMDRGKIEGGGGVNVMWSKVLVHSPTRTHRILASVSTSNVPLKTGREVLQHLERQARGPLEKDRGALVEMRKLLPTTVFKVSLDNSLGSECLRQDITIPEQDVPGGPILVQTMYALSCPHPDKPGYVIELGYSQRFFQGAHPVPWDAEAEPFFKSLMFTRLDKP